MCCWCCSLHEETSDLTHLNFPQSRVKRRQHCHHSTTPLQLHFDTVGQIGLNHTLSLSPYSLSLSLSMKTKWPKGELQMKNAVIILGCLAGKSLPTSRQGLNRKQFEHQACPSLLFRSSKKGNRNGGRRWHTCSKLVGGVWLCWDVMLFGVPTMSQHWARKSLHLQREFVYFVLVVFSHRSSYIYTSAKVLLVQRVAGRLRERFHWNWSRNCLNAELVTRQNVSQFWNLEESFFDWGHQLLVYDYD